MGREGATEYLLDLLEEHLIFAKCCCDTGGLIRLLRLDDMSASHRKRRLANGKARVYSPSALNFCNVCSRDDLKDPNVDAYCTIGGTPSGSLDWYGQSKELLECVRLTCTVCCPSGKVRYYLLVCVRKCCYKVSCGVGRIEQLASASCLCGPHSSCIP